MTDGSATRATRIKPLLKELFTELDGEFKAPLERFPHGIEELRPLVKRLHPGELVVVAGPTSLVHAFQAHLMLSATRPKNLVAALLLTDGEPSRDSVRRLLCREALIGEWRLRGGDLERDMMTRVTEAAITVSDRDIVLDDTELDAAEVVSQLASQWRVIAHKPDAIVVLSPERGRLANSARALRELKAISLPTEAVIVVGAGPLHGKEVPSCVDVVLEIEAGKLIEGGPNVSVRGPSRVEVVRNRRGPLGAFQLDLQFEQLGPPRKPDGREGQ
jgi:hypothetical protein